MLAERRLGPSYTELLSCCVPRTRGDMRRRTVSPEVLKSYAYPGAAVYGVVLDYLKSGDLRE